MLFFILSLFFLVLHDFNLYFLIYILLLIYVKNYVYSNNNIILYKLFFFNKSSLFQIFLLLKKAALFLSEFLNSLVTQLRWKPLFKRSSYYGIYRSSRNQWLNK